MLILEYTVPIVLCLGVVAYAIWLLGRVKKHHASQSVRKTQLGGGARILFLIFGIGFSFCGGVGAVVGLMELVVAHETQRWPTTLGHVIESHIVYNKTGPSGHMRYVYSVEDVKYKSGSVAGVWSSLGRGVKEVEKYPKGASVSVFYDPNDPSNSVLETGPSITRTGWWVVSLSAFL